MQNGEHQLAQQLRWHSIQPAAHSCFMDLCDGGRAVPGGPVRSVAEWGKPDFNNYKKPRPQLIMFLHNDCDNRI